MQINSSILDLFTVQSFFYFFFSFPFPFYTFYVFAGKFYKPRPIKHYRPLPTLKSKYLHFSPIIPAIFFTCWAAIRVDLLFSLTSQTRTLRIDINLRISLSKAIETSSKILKMTYFLFRAKLQGSYGGNFSFGRSQRLWSVRFFL